jgi:hypothetical protein
MRLGAMNESNEQSVCVLMFASYGTTTQTRRQYDESTVNYRHAGAYISLHT